MGGSCRLLGHRGAILPAGRPYQNSLAAFELALRVADGFESDACVSRDGEVFLIHEAKYSDPRCGVQYCAAEHLAPDSAAMLGRRRIDEVDRDTLRRFRLKDGSPIPTLEEALALFVDRPDKLFNIELKGAGAAEAVIPLLASALWGGRIARSSLLVSSFNHGALRAVRHQLPEVPIGALFVAPDQPPTPLFPWDPQSGACYLPLNRESLAEPTLAALAPDFVVIPDSALTPETVEDVVAVLPKARIVAWVFTERREVEGSSLPGRLGEGISPDRLAALIVDDPARALWTLPVIGAGRG